MLALVTAARQFDCRFHPVFGAVFTITSICREGALTVMLVGAMMGLNEERVEETKRPTRMSPLQM